MKILRSICAFSVIILCACNNQITTTNNDKINQKISALENEITKLQSSVDNIKNSDLVNLEEEVYSKKIAIFTPSNKAFQTLDTGNGILLISLKNIEEYADGYKITFSIGNPSTATYNNIHITLMYGPKSKDENAIDLIRSTEFNTEINQGIMPGYWNDVQVVLSNTKKEQLNYIWVKLSAQSIELNVLPPKTN